MVGKKAKVLALSSAPARIASMVLAQGTSRCTLHDEASSRLARLLTIEVIGTSYLRDKRALTISPIVLMENRRHMRFTMETMASSALVTVVAIFSLMDEMTFPMVPASFMSSAMPNTRRVRTAMGNIPITPPMAAPLTPEGVRDMNSLSGKTK